MRVQQASAVPVFKQDTLRNYQQLPDQTISAFSQSGSVDCQKVGFLSALWIEIFGTITPGSTPSGNYDANYFPWNILKRLTVRLNTGISLIDVSGYSLFLINSVMHRGMQPGPSGGPATGGWNNTGTTGPRTARYIAPSGAIGSAAKFIVQLKVPIALDDGLSGGLVQLQNQAYTATVEYLLGAASDFAAVGASMGTGPTISATLRVTQEHYSLPNDPRSFPNLRLVHQWLQQDINWSSSGQQIYQPPLGGVVSRVIIDPQNNGVPQAFFSSASDPTTPNVGNLTIQFAGSQRPEVVGMRTRLMQQYYEYGYDLPQGVLVHEFSTGGGSLEVGWDGQNAYDTGILTDFELLTDINVTPTNGIIRYVRELLLPRSA